MLWEGGNLQDFIAGVSCSYFCYFVCTFGGRTRFGNRGLNCDWRILENSN